MTAVQSWFDTEEGMKKVPVLILLMLAGCATPVTTMQKEHSIVECGGGTAGSVFGGLIGYTVQENHDHDCVEKYAKQGYKIVTPTPTDTDKTSNRPP